jgi:hypothetical protein
MNRIIMTAVVGGAALAWLMPINPARAATWVGGTGDWVSASDNWGLGVGVYPGDSSHTTETTAINSGTVNIKAGDNISFTASPGLLTVGIGSVLNQTGGSLWSNSRMTVYGQYNLGDGLLDGNSNFWISRGGVYSISGGQFGTRSTNTLINSLVDFSGYGSGTFEITGGKIDVHSIHMQDLIVNAGYPVKTAVVQVTGNEADLNTLYWYLKSATGTTATAGFTFSSAGISGWDVTSNNALDLGIGDNRGLLSVNVDAFTSDGTTGFSLIDYRGAIQGDGTFGGVSILDSHYAGGLTPGTLGDLQPGQYYLNMADSNVGDGSALVLYFNNTVPEPGALGLVLLGGLTLVTRRRKARMG